MTPSGHDVLTIAEMGRADQALPDKQVFAFARSEGPVLVALNRKHFIRLPQASPDHAGIIVCTFDANFIALAQLIDTALSADANLSGRLVRVNRPP